MHSVAAMKFKIVRKVWGQRPICNKWDCDSTQRSKERVRERKYDPRKASPTLKNPEGIPGEGQQLLVKFSRISSRLYLKLDK